MPKTVVGLRLGSSSVAAAQVVHGRAPELVRAIRSQMPAGLVSAGEVRDPQGLGEVLRDLFRRTKLPRKSVRVGIGNGRIGVRRVEITGAADAQELRHAVLFRAQEALPIPIEEAVFDFQVLEERVAEDGQRRFDVLMAVAYRDIVEGMADACTRAGLRVVGVDLEAFALLRALTPPRIPAATALAAVNVGAERSILAVSQGTTCEYVRVLDWGSDRLTAALAVALQIDAHEAERVKLNSVLPWASLADAADGDAQAIGEALMTGMRGFARELVSSLEYYQSQPDSLALGELVLAGGGSKLAGLAPALEELIGVSVRVGDPTAGLSVRDAALEAVGEPGLAVPIGLGMGR